MFPNSQIFGPLFWIVLGLVYAVMLYSFSQWTRIQNIKMTWWKWLLSILVYIMLSLSVATGFTLFAEKEMRAGVISIGFFGLISIILGVLLFRFVLKPEKKSG